MVSDRYQNYFNPRWKHVAGNQACLSHLLRDYEDCAETYPGAVWPVQAQRALRGLIHAWHAARGQGLTAIPADVLKPLAHEFRHAVLTGLASVPRVPGPKNSTKQRAGRELLEFGRDRRDDVLRFTADTSIWPTNNISERVVRPLKTQQKISGRLASNDRVAADRPFYSGKHKRHGMNLQVIASPAGDIVWVSGALPGAVHDKNAEWIWGVLAELEAAGLVVLADKGCQGSTYAKIPYKGKNKPDSQKQANKAHAKLRSPGERANAQLKSWRILRKLRCCPWRAGQLAKAIHVLQIREA